MSPNPPGEEVTVRTFFVQPKIGHGGKDVSRWLQTRGLTVRSPNACTKRLASRWSTVWSTTGRRYDGPSESRILGDLSGRSGARRSCGACGYTAPAGYRTANRVRSRPCRQVFARGLRLPRGESKWRWPARWFAGGQYSQQSDSR